MPMGEYTDFDDCVLKNQDKDNPDAYCGAIKAKIEGKSERVIYTTGLGQHVIYYKEEIK